MQDIFKLIKNSKNALIEAAYVDFLNFNEKCPTKENLIGQIENTIYTTQCEYDQWGNDADFSQKCINEAKKLLYRIKKGAKNAR